MKKRIFLIITQIFLFLNAITAEYFMDKAGLLSNSEAQQIENRLAEVSKANDAGIYIITVKDFSNYGSSVESATEKIYKQWNLGYGENSEGYIMLLSMNDRSFDLYAHGPRMKTCFIGRGRTIEKSFLPSFSKDQWFVGFDKFISKVEFEIEEYGLSSEQQTGSNSYTERPMTNEQKAWLIGAIVGILLIALIISLAIFFSEKKKLNNIAFAYEADRYESKKGVLFKSKYDRFTHQTVRVIHHESNNSSGRSGGGGGSHHSGHF